MWCVINDDGMFIYFFVEVFKVIYLYYIVCLIGGMVFLFGMFLMVYNMYKIMSILKVVFINIVV